MGSGWGVIGDGVSRELVDSAPAAGPVDRCALSRQRRLTDCAGAVMQANLISHAVLPGLALAVAFGLPPSVGGSLSGLLGAIVAERLLGGPR